ncbi:MAG: beta galactosidase jelly roll domain-containing protein [Cytophagales bacterium]|nr:beta galactosidase jelly roll domain-containing protein [Cytophagales bacterium]
MKLINHKQQHNRFGAIFALLAMVSFTISHAAPSYQGELTNIINLKGRWKFSIGERIEWLRPGYNDDDWESVFVPDTWEEQGFHGYNGFATYRKSFYLDDSYADMLLYLGLGYIDDVDEVYVNGKKIGSSGSFPPRYQTAFNARRQYFIPNDLLNFNGKNVIAVVVYDAQQHGGIVGGDIGIFTTKYGIKVDVPLQGTWKFRLRDNIDWARKDYDDTNWDELFVPGKWEDQQYRDYNGYAWYRTTFKFRNDLGDRPVLLLGKIDDADQVYVNGKLIGVTGRLIEGESKRVHIDGNEFNAFRGYYVPEGLIKQNEENVIAVRVYDATGVGGIYEGPIGLITQKNYIEFWRNKKLYK